MDPADGDSDLLARLHGLSSRTARERLKLGAWEPATVEGGTFTWDPETRVLEVAASTQRVVIQRAGS